MVTLSEAPFAIGVPAMMVQLLGMLAGASAGHDRAVGSGNGFPFIAIDPAGLCGREHLAATVERFTAITTSVATDHGEPLRMPYERSVRERARRRERGIPVGDELVEQLSALAAAGEPLPVQAKGCGGT